MDRDAALTYVRNELIGQFPFEAAVITPDGNLALAVRDSSEDPLQFFLLTVEEARLVPASAGSQG